jgi:MFS family permease
LQPRWPPTIHSPQETTLDTSVFTHPLFYSASFSNIFQGLAFFLPFIYLPSNAISLSLPPSSATLTLSLLNLSQIVGQIVVGYLSDRRSIYIPLFLSPFFSAWSIFMLWGFAKSFGPLVVFSILYGAVSGLLAKGEVVQVGYGVGRYQWLVVFVGGSMLISSLGGLGWFVKDKSVDISAVFGSFLGRKKEGAKI